MEGDADLIKIDLVVAVISTHALTWRATPRRSQEDRFCNYFYPRPHMEGDGTTVTVNNLQDDFYPRPHMEGDFSRSHGWAQSPYFYPRPHMEGDLLGERRIVVQLNFYPRPHMEGDPPCSASDCSVLISTHALTWRATECHCRRPSAGLRFLPTPSHGGRPAQRVPATSTSSTISTHALTWRATVSLRWFDRQVDISTHALTWRATR